MAPSQPVARRVIASGVLVFIVLAALASYVEARPTVRNIKSNSEFKKLLKHHADVTGLPVIVDFYSDGCGPCRMIAPHFKKLAEQYKDQAVFAKVDINYNHDIASEQGIRSMPTFKMFLFGKKRDEFSGADTNRIQSMTQQLVRESKEKNIEVTVDALKAFYQEQAPEKLMEMDDKKLEEIITKAGKGGGPGHHALVKALKKKYNGKAPKTRPRTVEGGASGDSKPKPAPPTPPPKGSKAEPTKPNLHLASMQELEKELERRKEEEEEKRQEAATDEDDDFSDFPIYTKEERPETEQLVIIGSGPAGLSAAIYAARAGLRPVIVAPPIGGQLQGKGVGVENYPGVNESTGPALVQAMQRQAARYGAVFEQDLVAQVDLTKRPFTIATNDTRIQTHAVVLATGADSRWLGAEGEYHFRGGGVSTCATCDGFLYAGKEVVVVGGGDTAMEDALVLARTSKSVTVIHRRDAFRASKVLAERVLNHDKIKVIWNAVVEAFEGITVRTLSNGLTVQLTEDGSVVEEDFSKVRVKEIRERLDAAGISYAGIKDKEELVRVLQAGIAEAVAGGGEEDGDEGGGGLVEEKPALTRVRLKYVNGGEGPAEVACAAAFVAIGHDPNTKIVENQLEMDGGGYLKVTAGSTRTSLPGVFAAGDVADQVYRQAITSAATGAMAALDAERWLSEQGHCTK
mmetsp:Transcript_40323/g.95800  ORF Transcript_40323/g.95800 Transcript_40323/m.95800 type:complete len:686 (+) Transcript_40323:130-2187(+)